MGKGKGYQLRLGQFLSLYSTLGDALSPDPCPRNLAGHTRAANMKFSAKWVDGYRTKHLPHPNNRVGQQTPPTQGPGPGRERHNALCERNVYHYWWNYLEAGRVVACRWSTINFQDFLLESRQIIVCHWSQCPMWELNDVTQYGGKSYKELVKWCGEEYFCQIFFFTIRCTMLRGSADGPSDLLVWHTIEFCS